MTLSIDWRPPCAALALLALASVSVGGTFNYGDYAGSAPGQADFLNVREESLTDPGPLFGSPARVGNALTFSPVSFAAAAQNGSQDVTAGTLRLDIDAGAGYLLEEVTIQEFGDYLLAGGGTAATFAQVAGTVTIEALDGPETIIADLLAAPTPPYALPADLGGGTWTATKTVDLSGLGFRRVSLSFADELSAESEAGTTAFIEKKDISGLLIVVPEPASAALIGVGACLGLLRRRK